MKITVAQVEAIRAEFSKVPPKPVLPAELSTKMAAVALAHGASAHVVASSLGHESISTTLQSYAKPEAVEGARQRRVLTVLGGGQLAS